MKLTNWLKAFWLSFQVAQNAYRLALLQNLANECSIDREVSETRQATLTTYRNVVRWFLDEHPGLTDNIWSLEQARDLFRCTKNLIGIGETILHGSD